MKPFTTFRTRADRRSSQSIWAYFILLLLTVFAFSASFTSIKTMVRSSQKSSETQPFEKSIQGQNEVVIYDEDTVEEEDVNQICRGVESLELWGESVVWGTSNLVDTAEQCCQQCKSKCKPDSPKCECNSWVYCGDKEKCLKMYKQCWLKQQTDVLFPEVHSSVSPWTSGVVHPEGKGIIKLMFENRSIRIKLNPTWAPLTVNYIRDMLRLRHCTGCQFYRAEAYNGGDLSVRGTPQGLLQGTLYTEGVRYKDIPLEATPFVKRGFVCLIQGGPDFFISLADHLEWGHSHTVFGEVLPQDMKIVEEIVTYPTKAENWGNNLEVRVLVEPLNFKVGRES